MKHLTDRQMQAFLDGQDRSQNSAAQKHLQECDFCRSELSAYQKVYQALDENPGFALQPDFTNLVLNRLQARAEKRIQLWETAFVVFVGLLGLGIVFYFVNGSIFLEMARSSALALRLFEQTLTWVYSYHMFHIWSLEIIGMVLVVLVVIRLIDLLYSQLSKPSRA